MIKKLFMIGLIITFIPIQLLAETQSVSLKLKNILTTVGKKVPCTKTQAAWLGGGLVSIGVIVFVLYKLKPKKQLTSDEKQSLLTRYHSKWSWVQSKVTVKATDEDRKERIIFAKKAIKLLRAKHPTVFYDHVYIPLINEFIGIMNKEGVKEFIDPEMQQELIDLAEKIEKRMKKGKLPNQWATF